MGDSFQLNKMNITSVDKLLSSNKDFDQIRNRASKASPWPIRTTTLGLVVTTILGCVLLVACFHGWTFSPRAYRWITINRATVQLALQLFSNILGLAHVSSLTILINRASRLYWRRQPVTLDTLRFWHGLCVRFMDWSISLSLVMPLLVFILLTAAPSAIWAGALTPVATMKTHRTTISLPGYSNTPHIKEWPSEIDAQGPILRSSKGLFAYSVGMQMQGSLLASASSATTVDNTTRQHTKLDNSQFIYIGRSFGMGSSVGLVDDALLASDLHVGYTYHEAGYETSVSCVYNSSTEFVLMSDPISPALYEVHGSLPNSGSAGPEESTYVGHGTSAIVAIGVGRDPSDPRRMLGIAAGKSYENLDTTQCSMDFIPTLFNVSVGITGRNITVTPIKQVDKFDYGGDLTQTLMRQFELIANDQTNLYVSLVGNSFNDSISNWMIANNGSTGLSLRDATLPGLENALTAMLDDMLVAYASAQLMIQQDSIQTTVTLESAALRVGEDVYIYAIFVINAIILLLLAGEAVRTNVWTDVPILDFMDPSGIILACMTSRTDLVKGLWRESGSIKATLVDSSEVVLDLRGFRVVEKK